MLENSTDDNALEAQLISNLAIITTAIVAQNVANVPDIFKDVYSKVQKHFPVQESDVQQFLDKESLDELITLKEELNNAKESKPNNIFANFVLKNMFDGLNRNQRREIARQIEKGTFKFSSEQQKELKILQELYLRPESLIDHINKKIDL